MNPIEENASRLLAYMVEHGLDQAGISELRSALRLDDTTLNDATVHLEDLGAIEVLRELGNPFFYAVMLRSQGRFLYYEQKDHPEPASGQSPMAEPLKAINPVGSPFGFTEHDWKAVAVKRTDKTKLFVVFGLQFESDNYDYHVLVSNVRAHFERAVASYNRQHPSAQIVLEFQPLRAGYGGHLFNEIASDIIGSDIAVFDTTHLNSNVMIELGVALTWGIRVIPIREQSSPDLPSDIAGQTWIKYRDSAQTIEDSDFDAELLKAVERAIARK